jgi:hypothetical protein
MFVQAKIFGDRSAAMKYINSVEINNMSPQDVFEKAREAYTNSVNWLQQIDDKIRELEEQKKEHQQKVNAFVSSVESLLLN